MSEFDKSGYVEIERDKKRARIVLWDDLTLFTQGYIEALLCDGGDELSYEDISGENRRQAGFSDLAPETLARIVEDCEKIGWLFPVSPNRSGGWQAWAVRQTGKWLAFLPLTVQVGDDGKVRFA